MTPEKRAAAYAAAGKAMVPLFMDDDPRAEEWEEKLFEWEPCGECPNRNEPCACSGRPWPSAAVRAAIDAALSTAYPEIHVAMGFLSQQTEAPKQMRLVGFLSQQTEAPKQMRLVPVFDSTNPGTETLFMTMPISLDLLDDEDERERFAEYAAEILSEKFTRLVKGWPDRGPL